MFKNDRLSFWTRCTQTDDTERKFTFEISIPHRILLLCFSHLQRNNACLVIWLNRRDKAWWLLVDIVDVDMDLDGAWEEDLVSSDVHARELLDGGFQSCIQSNS